MYCIERFVFVCKYFRVTQSHFTTIAGFVSSLAEDIARVFTQVLYLCERPKLSLRPANGSHGASGAKITK